MLEMMTNFINICRLLENTFDSFNYEPLFSTLKHKNLDEHATETIINAAIYMNSYACIDGYKNIKIN